MKFFIKTKISLILFLLISMACGGTTQTATPLIVSNNISSETPAVPSVTNVVIENANITFYDITGSTENELRDSMNSLRPTDPFDSNLPVDAYTQWFISWNWNGYGEENCDLESAVVSYEIKIVFPRWQAPADANPELITKWNSYIENLALHEKGHVDNIVNNYLQVKTAIQHATCTTADAAAQNALVPLRAADAKYDSETGHGATQGAIFP